MNRREFARGVGWAVGAAWTSGRVRAGALDEGPPTPTVRVRPDVMSLSPNCPQIEALRRGVAEMKRRSETDPNSPTGWIGQARIHEQACPHNNWFFLPWHRAYLYYFEEICRQASGDPEFVLPYWDWTSHPTLPPTFLGGADNPLDHVSNNPNFPGPHQGRRIGADEPIDPEFNGPLVLQEILDNADFDSAIGSDRRATAPRPFRGNQSVLEGSPHNNVHGQVSGDMATFWSPRDPIFWLHHANIDRIWTLWDARHPGSFPAVDSFLDYNMNVFFDTSGNQVGKTVRDVLSTQALGYRYPGQAAEPPPVVAAREVAAVRQGLRIRSDVREVATRVEPLQVDLAPAAALSERLASIAAERQPVPATVRLRIGGIRQALPPGAYFRVFLNCDYLTPATPTTDPHYVGSFAFFDHADGQGQGHGRGEGEAGHGAAHEGGTSFYVDATRTVRLLGRQEIFDPSRIRVGLVTRARAGVEVAEQVLRLEPGQVEVAVLDQAR